ncbi:MAG: SPOCS domain-containing protein [Lachnospiraceae bacterium]
MELEKQIIHRNFEKARASSQMTVSDDYSLPETKPPVEGILQKKGELIIRDVHTEKSKVRIRGVLKLQILYRTMAGAVHADCLETEHAFDEVLYVDGAESGDHLKLNWVMESLEVSVIHSAKLGIRAVVTVYGEIIGNESAELTTGVGEAEDLYEKKEQFLIAEPVLDRKDSYRIRDEFSLPANRPNIKRLLWKNPQLRNMDLQFLEGQLGVKGEAVVFVLYEGEDGNIYWAEQMLPFHGNLEVDSLRPEMFGSLDTEIAHQEIEVKPDYDGEMRVIQIEIMLDIQMRIYEERECQVLQDLYSTSKKLIPTEKQTGYEVSGLCRKFFCKISQKESAEEGSVGPVQVLSVQPMLYARSRKSAEAGILAEGLLELQVLCMTSDSTMPLACRTLTIPYSQLLEIPEFDETDRWQLTEQLDNLQVTLSGSGQLEVKGVISLYLCVLGQRIMKNIVDIEEEDYSAEELQKQPGMMIHFVQPQETLWEIARNHCTSVDDIRKLNELPGEEVVSGQKLILIKQAHT